MGLDVFTSLEEQNLFLIQTSQDTEQMLEEIQQKLAERKRTMGAQTFKLSQNIEELAERVKQVHAACGNDNSDHDRDTLQMLGAIEAKLEEFLAALDEAEECGLKQLVEREERNKERDRRDFVR